jgi:hypothetical protein
MESFAKGAVETDQRVKCSKWLEIALAWERRLPAPRPRKV